MNKDLKKIIAREGLILLGFIVWVIIIRRSNVNGIFYDLAPRDYAIEQKFYFADRLENLVIYCPYLIYLVIRFIIWAIKALKEK